MQFYSLFDLICYKSKEKGINTDELYAFFKSKKISKGKLTDLQQTSYIPNDTVFRNAVCEFLEMNELEVSLAMGHIPSDYRTSYFSHIKEIASLLDKEERSNIVCPKPFFTTKYGKLYNEDCVLLMKSMPDSCVDLIFADPPFNLGKTYDPGIDDNMTMSQYLDWTYQWLDECIRILKPGGRIFVYNLPKWCVYIASHLQEELTFWDWIAVDMKFNLPIQNRLYPAHYALVSFIKGTKATTFHNQRIPLQTCRHCGGEIKDYGGYKAKMNPQGVNVSDVWEDIYPVRHSNTKNRKYNELSVKLLDRIISMSTNEGDIVFDPFGGSGTTYAVAQLLKREWIGCELGDCDIIKNRLLNLSNDQEQLDRIKKEKEVLFPPKVADLRKKNGFWLCDDVSDKSGKDAQHLEQLSFNWDDMLKQK